MRLSTKLGYWRERLTPPFFYKTALKSWYHRCTGDRLNLERPLTFSDKINWIKLNRITPEMTRLSDKLSVRDWVKEKIGEDYLVRLLGSWPRSSHIPFEELPRCFVLKANHGSHMNIVVKDKESEDLEFIRRKSDEWLRYNFAFMYGFQMQYRDIVPRLMAEEYLVQERNDESIELADYKLHCFDGRVESIEYISGESGKRRLTFLDTDWKPLKYRTATYPLHGTLPERPNKLKELISVAETLAEGFPYVRVDLYLIEDRVKFGEMTFTPSSGAARWLPEGTDRWLGELMVIL